MSITTGFFIGMGIIAAGAFTAWALAMRSIYLAKQERRRSKPPAPEDDTN